MIQKLLNKIRWIIMLFVTTNFQKKINSSIPIDKQFHFIVSLMISVFLSSVLSFIIPIILGIAIGVTAAFLLVTIVKEIILDLFGSGTFDWWDILANLCGSIAGGLIMGLIVIILKAAEIIN